jgi:hypothetical protein
MSFPTKPGGAAQGDWTFSTSNASVPTGATLALKSGTTTILSGTDTASGDVYLRGSDSVADNLRFKGSDHSVELQLNTVAIMRMSDTGCMGIVTRQTTLASGNTIAPQQVINSISGTAVIKTITVPAMIQAMGGGVIYLLPTAIWTWDTTGNIAVAGTAVVGRAVTFVWDGWVTSKWHPSYV